MGYDFRPPCVIDPSVLSAALSARSTIKRLILTPCRAAARSICSFSWSLIKISIPRFLPVFARRARETPGSIFRFFVVTGYPSARFSLEMNPIP